MGRALSTWGGVCLLLNLALPGCFGVTREVDDDAGLDAGVDAGTDAGTDVTAGDRGQDGGPDETGDGGPGALVRFSVQATEHCPVDPPVTPGLARATPSGARAGLLGLELLRARDDPAPLDLPLGAPLLEIDLVAGGVVFEGVVAPGTYRFLRYSLAYGSVTIPATGHVGGFAVPGTLEFDVATAAYTDAAGEARAAGDLLATFATLGTSFSYPAAVPLDCPLSDGGGLVETGDRYRITVPVPGGPLTITTGAPRQERLARFPLAGAVTWLDLDGANFSPGVLDILQSPAGSETPARLPICDLLLSDRCEAGAAAVRHAPAWPMPDSATTACTDASAVIPCPAPGAKAWGQDGCYAVNPTRYTIGEETVRDEVTGLLWQRYAAPASLDWWEARDTCAELVLAGRDDWSLPSRLELVSLLDLGRFGPSIDLAAFPDAPSDFFWSASPALFSSLAFGVRFDQGFVYDHDPRVSGRVRCVADGRPGAAARFVVAGEVVEDRATGLAWQRGLLAPLRWLDALTSCEALTLGGFDDWRLPTLKELLTVIDEVALNPSADIAAFPDTPAQWYWASSAGLGPPDYAWTVSFTDGYCTPAAVDELYLVRCVRDP